MDSRLANAALATPPAEGPGARLVLRGAERWFAVHCQPNGEARAEAHLHRQGFRFYLPRVLRTVRHARKTSTVKAPFFPRYGFIALDPGRYFWRPVNGTFGVASLVMAGDAPLPLPSGVVESLIEITGADGVIGFGGRLKVGQKVRLLSGPFANLVGELERIDGNDRVRVLLGLLNGTVSVRMSVSLLAPVGG